MSRGEPEEQGREGTIRPVERAPAASALGLTQTQTRLISSHFSHRRGPAPAFTFLPICCCSSSLSATPPASPLQSLSCGWSSSGAVVGPFGVGGNIEAYSEQRLCGLRKTSPHFPSHLHLSGLWAAQVIRPRQPVASTQLVLRCQHQGRPSVHPIWPLLFAPGWQLLEKIHPGQWRQPRGRRCTERGDNGVSTGL